MADVITIAESFAAYRKAVIPATAPAIQIEECRRAFYAGSYFMLVNLRESIGDDSTNEEDGIRQLERLQAECETFLSDLDRQPPPAPVMEQSSYNVRHPDVEHALRNIAGGIKPQLPDGFGFTLMIFSYGQTGLKGEGAAGSMFYISSAQRADMIKAMKEFITRNTQ
jgi:hypothetical protein